MAKPQMRPLSKLLVALSLAGAAIPALAAEPVPAWTRYADCAAAYAANAGIKDASRSGSMTSQIGDVAKDYADAAAKRNRQQTKAPEAKARSAVDARIKLTLARFSKQKREAVETYIEACPQVPE
jgi:hypothetical protein